jgi:DNA-binding transcriptional regulator YdaS (Cro superfamily)
MAHRKVTDAKRSEGLRLAIAAAGSIHRLALLAGLSPSAVYRWTRIPDARILQIEAATGVPRDKLRSELYREGDAT